MVEQSTVANHQQGDAWVCTVEQGLKTTARHACHTDVFRVYLVVIGRLLVGILGYHPVDGLYLLLTLRHRTTIPLVGHGDEPRSHNNIAMRGYLVEEFDVLEGRIVAGSVAPYQDGQTMTGTKWRQVLGNDDGMGLKRRLFFHDGFVLAQAAFFNNTCLLAVGNTYNGQNN